MSAIGNACRMLGLVGAGPMSVRKRTRRLAPILLALGLGSAALAQTPEEVRTKAEIKAFYRDLNAAIAARDRPALERLLDENLVWVHGFGYADDRATVIAEALERDPPLPMRVPEFGPGSRLVLRGDTAVVRLPMAKTMTGEPAFATIVLVRKDGRWRLLQTQATVMVVLPPEVPLPPGRLAEYAGAYAFPDGPAPPIALENGVLVSIGRVTPKRRLVPIGPDRFMTKVGAEYRFERGPDGKVSAYIVRNRQGERRAAKAD
jgi:hypothetical protein